MAHQGIDYGMGRTNIDAENGIRFGVIPAHDVGGFWYEESEAVYPEPEPKDEDDEGADDEDDGMGDYAEPIAFQMVNEEYRAFQNADDCDIFIEKSPFYAFAQFCSPCAPGAGYLRNPGDGSVKAYCFGPDCFWDRDEIPHDIYRVEDNFKVASKGGKPED